MRSSEYLRRRLARIRRKWRQELQEADPSQQSLAGLYADVEAAVAAEFEEGWMPGDVPLVISFTNACFLFARWQLHPEQPDNAHADVGLATRIARRRNVTVRAVSGENDEYPAMLFQGTTDWRWALCVMQFAFGADLVPMLDNGVPLEHDGKTIWNVSYPAVDIAAAPDEIRLSTLIGRPEECRPEDVV